MSGVPAYNSFDHAMPALPRNERCGRQIPRKTILILTPAKYASYHLPIKTTSPGLFNLMVTSMAIPLFVIGYFQANLF